MTVPTQVASPCYIRLVTHTMQARTEQHQLPLLLPQGHLLVSSPAIASRHDSGSEAAAVNAAPASTAALAAPAHTTYTMRVQEGTGCLAIRQSAMSAAEAKHGGILRSTARALCLVGFGTGPPQESLCASGKCAGRRWVSLVPWPLLHGPAYLL